MAIPAYAAGELHSLYVDYSTCLLKIKYSANFSVPKILRET